MMNSPIPALLTNYSGRESNEFHPTNNFDPMPRRMSHLSLPLSLSPARRRRTDVDCTNSTNILFQTMEFKQIPQFRKLEQNNYQMRRAGNGGGDNQATKCETLWNHYNMSACLFATIPTSTQALLVYCYRPPIPTPLLTLSSKEQSGLIPMHTNTAGVLYLSSHVSSSHGLLVMTESG